MFISLPAEDSLPPELRDLWRQASPGAKKFIQAMSHAPAHAARLFPYYTRTRSDNRLGVKLTELVRLAIAETTQCPICLEARLPEAINAGMTEEHVAHLTEPDEGDFTARERAAVRFAYKFGSDHFAIGESDFRELHSHFAEEEVIELGMLCAQFLGFGRLVMVLGLADPSCPIADLGTSDSPTDARSLVAEAVK